MQCASGTKVHCKVQVLVGNEESHELWLYWYYVHRYSIFYIGICNFFQRPLFNRCLPKITFPKVAIAVTEDEKVVDQNGTVAASLSDGNNVTEPLDNLDPTFVDYEG